jgi:hypothetical protein
MARKHNNHRKKITRLNVLKQINLNAAGIDVGDSEMYVAVPEDRDEQFVRVFGTFTRDLVAIAQWLMQCKVTTVAMESTGVYWIPLFEILVEYGFEVLQVLQLYDYYGNLIAEIDAECEKMHQQLPSLSQSLPSLKPLKRNTDKKTKNAPAFDLRSHLYRITGVDLIHVDGLNSSTTRDIITNIGTDMSKWPTSKHFCSWLRLSPENKKTGGPCFTPPQRRQKMEPTKHYAWPLSPWLMQIAPSAHSIEE